MPKKILLVDDDQDLVYIIQSFLGKQGYQVVTAENGAKALEMVKTEVPDLMIVDLTMPVLGGWHFTSRVRQDPRYKETPIIVLSGLFQEDSEPEQFEFASAHMAKPFDVFKLLGKIKALLNENP
jgi:two-component system alkaline phosphatase synthesis response regulator PhoP